MGLGSMGDSQGLGFRLRFRLRVGQGDRVCGRISGRLCRKDHNDTDSTEKNNNQHIFV